MARDGNGTYTAPVNTWNPAINGVLATAGDWQQLLNDIVAALTQSVSRDGQTPMTGNLALGNNKITGLTPGSGTGEALAFQQLFNQGTQADIASAGTTDIGVQNTNFLRVTGNTTITSFGTNYRGPRFLVFEQNITLTNSSTLVLPGGANLAVTAGDALIVIPGATLGTADKWIVVAYRKNAIPLETALTATSSGNLGLGVPPSAWAAYRALQVGYASVADTAAGNNAFFGSNVFFNGTNFRYIATSTATNYRQLSGAHEWYTAPSGTAGSGISFSQVMTLDASGALAIGTTSISAGARLVVEGGNIVHTGSQINFNPGAATQYELVNRNGAGFDFYVNSAATLAARIDSSGNLGLGVTPSAPDVANIESFAFERSGGRVVCNGKNANTVIDVNQTFDDTDARGAIRFFRNETQVGSISVSTSATAYNTSSDYRLKNTIAPMTGALAKVALLKPCTYKWNADGSDGEGFIAHELAEVVPQCVTGQKDAVDAEGKPQYQGIDTSFLVATLTAALQELNAKFDAYVATHP